MSPEVELYAWTGDIDVEETVTVEGMREEKVKDEEGEDGAKPDVA
jgi:hypothetical protein